jgi:hypothetical protein
MRRPTLAAQAFVPPNERVQEGLGVRGGPSEQWTSQGFARRVGIKREPRVYSVLLKSGGGAWVPEIAAGRAPRRFQWQRNGRLPACALIFPNIEMRLAVGTVKGKWVNVHLLVSPDDPGHLAELKRFLARLTFKAHDDRERGL